MIATVIVAAAVMSAIQMVFDMINSPYRLGRGVVFR
jgi:hypothetical protein